MRWGIMDTGIGELNLKLDCISGSDFKKLIELMSTVKFGSIQLIIQDGKVIQIEKIEKHRLK
jgi:hypothetical protein